MFSAPVRQVSAAAGVPGVAGGSARAARPEQDADRAGRGRAGARSDGRKGSWSSTTRLPRYTQRLTPFAERPSKVSPKPSTSTLPVTSDRPSSSTRPAPACGRLSAQPASATAMHVPNARVSRGQQRSLTGTPPPLTRTIVLAGQADSRHPLFLSRSYRPLRPAWRAGWSCRRSRRHRAARWRTRWRAPRRRG